MGTRVWIDCDNTFFTSGCDIDDGLAIIYLHSQKNISIEGISSCFGNGSEEIVNRDTQKLLSKLNISKSKYYRGAVKNNDTNTDAAKKLAQIVKDNPYEISILAIGPLTNLYGAYLHEKDFFDLVKNIVVMGGVTSPLLVGNVYMDELNLSSDPVAAYNVLSKVKDLSIITGNNCKDILFTFKNYDKYIKKNTATNYIASLISEHFSEWIDFNRREYGINGFYNWDVLAAVYLCNPQYFFENKQECSYSISSLKSGNLACGNLNNFQRNISLPKIQYPILLENHIYNAFLSI